MADSGVDGSMARAAVSAVRAAFTAAAEPFEMVSVDEAPMTA
jgi:hypothetical protein